MTVQALQDELRIQRDLNQLLQQDPASQSRDLALTSEPTEENYRRLQAEHERQAKELFLLRKTLEEMELRIDTQKQTLAARDESIKKLLEMLQSKGTFDYWQSSKTPSGKHLTYSPSSPAGQMCVSLLHKLASVHALPTK